ncbi:MAG: CDP-glycerol glycerophosphotransferase family protein [Microlunatus sp.]
MALVSIVIPVHNAGRYLEVCLESVRRQTYRDLQIICVDDGSTDGSAAVLGREAARDGRLQIIRQPNAGPGAARNAGLSKATGDYVMFVDADDCVPAAAIERHLQALRSGTAEFTTGRVERLMGSHRWPSTLHEKALSQLTSSARLYRNPSLLFDTTSWNKLFRRDYWSSHHYRFPEHCVFEDIALMTEAHARAASVAVVSEAVYWWRRRDDGTLSITMRRDDPELLPDRMQSIQRVRRLLADGAPASIKRAAEAKFLRQDLGIYLRDLEHTPGEFQREFVRLAQPFVAASPADVVEGLPPHLRAAYGLVMLGDAAEVVSFLAFVREQGGRLPVRRRWLLPRADLGPAAPVLPREYASALRRMPLRLGVTSLAWQGDDLVIEGYGYIDGVPLGHPLAALRRLQLVDAHGGQRHQLWLRPRRLPSVRPRARMSPSYEWSGFRAEISSTLLEPGPKLNAARWQLSLQVLAWGAASGGDLVVPRDALAGVVHRDRTGLVLRFDPGGADRRLIIEASRPATPAPVPLVPPGPQVEVSELYWIGNQLRVTFSGAESSDLDVQLAWCHCAGDEIRAALAGHEARFDVLAVPGPEGPAPLRAGRWSLMARQPGGEWRPVAMPESSVAATKADSRVGQVWIGPDGRGNVVMLVEALPSWDRSAIGQERLRRSARRGVARSSVEDVILVETWGGKAFSDNPRSLIETSSPAWRDAAVVVVVADRSIVTPPGVRTVVAGSRDHYDQRSRARLIISNDALPKDFVKRRGQRYLQTWHGTPLKRIGWDIERIRFRNKSYRQDLAADSAQWDWLISPNAYSTEIFRRAFAYPGPVLETGYPRNDLLASGDQALLAARRDRTRRWLGIGADQQVALWAPTWRDDAYVPAGGYGASMLVEPADLDALLPDGMVVLFRGHHLFAPQLAIGRPDRFRNVSGYPDVRDLMLASDALVTDYSSIMFDYALTGRPMVFFAPDLLHYQYIRGLYLDLAEIAPGPVLSTAAELGDALRDLSNLGTEYGRARTRFRRRFCALDDGAAAARVWAALAETT